MSITALYEPRCGLTQEGNETIMDSSPARPERANFDALVDFVRNLRGAPASVLLILLLSGRSLTQKELEYATSFSDKPLKRAIAYLQRRGIVESCGSAGWLMTTTFRHSLMGFLEESHGSVTPRTEHHRCRVAKPDWQDQNGTHLELSALLRHMGVSSPAFRRLSARADLSADPARVLAWWWYCLTQDWATNRPGLLIRCLENGEEPPANFVALARVWPSVTLEDRLEMSDLRWRAWSAPQLAEYFTERYPQLTAEAAAAYMALCQKAPQELGYR
jgi:hypothetical protein